MKHKNIAAAAVAAGVLVPAALLLPGIPSARQKEPFLHRNIAHRGLHAADKTVPENSIPAFRAAAEAGYGVELDVQLSKDGQVVVFHDDTLDRVCGVHAAVADKTWQELCELRLCGTEERIPLFTEVLGTVRGRSPIICELKTGRRNRELCRKTYEIIEAYHGEICIESFDPTIVAWFRLHGRDLMRGQLATGKDDYPKTQKAALSFMLSRCMLNILARPQFIAYNVDAKRPLCVKMMRLCGAMLVGWTSHDPKNEQKNDTVIFEFYHPELRY